MTRENKAGLAVAGVFLTLVTTVGVMKWRGGPTPGSVAMSVPAVELEPEPPKAAEATPKPVEKVKAPETPASEVPKPMPAIDVAGQLNPAPTTPPGEPLKALEPNVVQEDEYVYVFRGPPAPDSSGLTQVKNEIPPPSGLPPVPGAGLPAPEIVLVPTAPQPGPSDLSPPLSVEMPKASAAPLPGVVPPPKVDPIPPIIEAPPTPGFPPPPGDLPPSVVTPPSPMPPSPPVAPVVVPPVKPMPVEPIIAPPPPEVKVVPPVPAAPIPVAPTNPPPPAVKEPTEKTSSGTPLEGSRFVPTVTLSPPVARNAQPPTATSPAPKIDIEPVGGREPVKPVAPTPDDLRPIAVPTPSGLQLNPVPTTPPSGSRATLPNSSLPSARTNEVQIAGGIVSAAPATPRVTRVDTSSHVCKQEDTWESISAQHLLSKNWADALRAYNMQSRFQNERVRTSGVFQPGDTVFIPPASVLDENFKTLIRKDGR